jgi:hypothetical protein
MELEKKSVVYQSTKQIESGEFINGHAKEDRKEIYVNQDNDGMALFKQKLEKLKMMYETGILTETEFDVEKKKLLELI